MTPALGLVLALSVAPAELSVAVGGPAQDPAYLPVYAAAALGTFAAEGVRPVLQKVKHPTAAINALREGGAAVAVTTTDQAVRGAWARGTPVRLLVAHTQAPELVVLVAGQHADRIRRIDDLRGQRVGVPGPGTTGHRLLAALLARQGLDPARLDLRSLGGAALAAGVTSGDLAAAVIEEPWATRALETGAARVLLDLRQPGILAQHLGGPFYETVSVTRTDEAELARLAPGLAAFARAVIRVQTWLAATAPDEVARRLPATLVGNRARFVDRLTMARSVYVPTAAATEAGIESTFRVLRAGSPWPVGLELTPKAFGAPPFVGEARAGLGPAPPAP